MDPGTRRLLSIIVVALLLLGGTLYALIMASEDLEPWFDGDGDDGDGEWEEGDLDVREDTVWRDWNRTLPGRVTVHPGVRLRIVDSRIEVPYESMMDTWWPWFDVRDDGGLQLVNSELVIAADPRLDDAYVNTDSGPGFLDNPNIWRAVDLRKARDPVLSFDIEWLQGSTYVIVAVQPTTEDELVPLGVLDPRDHGTLEWFQSSYSLSDYVGTVPRVVVLLDNEESQDVVISRLAVTDGDGPPEGDPCAARGVEDGYWETYEFVSFHQRMRWTESNSGPLIVCRGTLRLTDSEVRAPEGLARYNTGPHRPQMWTVDMDQTPTNLAAATVGGEVRMEGGLLEVVGSTLEYVPVVADGSEVVVEESALIGDHDLLTMAHPTGHVSGTHLNFTTPGVDRGALETMGIPWAISIEGTQDRFSVVDCSFTGGSWTGLHLMNCEALVEACTFADQRLAVWRHESWVGMTWDELNASNDFDTSCRYWYWETHDLQVDMDGLNKPPAPPWGHGDWDYVDYEARPTMPFSPELFIDGVRVVMVVPTLLVLPDEEREHAELSVRIKPRWADEEVVTFDTGISRMDVWFQDGPDDQEDDYDHYLTVYPELTNETGRVELVIRFGLETSRLYAPILMLYQDGDLVGEVPYDSSHEEWYYRLVRAFLNVTLADGLNELDVLLTATDLTQSKRVDVGWFNTTIQWASRNGTMEGMGRLLAGDEVNIFVEDGVTLTGGGASLGTESDWDEYQIQVLTGEGATLVLEDLNLSNYGHTELFLFGSGEVRLSNVTTYYMELYSYGGSLLFEDCSFTYVNMECYNTSVEVEGVIRYGITAHLQWGSNFTLEDVDTSRLLWLELYCLDCNVSLTNCHFLGGEYWCNVEIHIGGEANIDIVDCTFEVLVAFREFNLNWGYLPRWSLNITGCTFDGPWAQLILLGRTETVNYNTNMFLPMSKPTSGTVSGNTFRGDGSFMAFDPALSVGLLGENTFIEGARAWAVYSPSVGLSSYPNMEDCYNHTFLQGEGYSLVLPPTWFSHHNIAMVLVDVTDDPLAPLDQLVVPVMLRDFNRYYPNYQYGVVVGFAEVDVTLTQVTLDIPAWPGLGPYLETLLKGLEEGSNWWTDRSL